ncbi:MAG: epoxyqueuosine reductase QueH [Candidatus Uhrbacteria bacterium]
MTKLLIHVCCGTCGAWVPKKLSHDFDVTLFYFNPNIHPPEEYQYRLEGVKLMADELGLELVEGEYDPQSWFEFVLRTGPTSVSLSNQHDRLISLRQGFGRQAPVDPKNEPEGGARCQLCFEHRLRATAEYARDNKFDCFATTLTVGRRKPASKINPIGLRIASELGIEFLDRDFKKAGGEDLSQIRARDLGVYRQEYCGCVYSRLRGIDKRKLVK